MKSGLSAVRQLRLLEDRTAHFAREHSLWRSGGTVVLAVSGGADSLAMLYLMAGLALRQKISLVVAHLNHGMRGQTADEDQEFVAGAAGGLGLPFIARREDVPGLARALKIGLEEAGRAARRRFLDRVLEETSADSVATAHTRSDHVETVLLHLFRGAGLHGLVGIPLHGYGNRIRPMLCHTREETQLYCRLAGLTWRDDPANDDPAFQRNRIRKVVLPLLREQINPSVDNAMVSLSQVAADALALVEAEGEKLLQNVQTDVEGVYDRAALRSGHPAAVSEALRLALHAQRSEPTGVTFDDIERVVRSLKSGGKTPLSGGQSAEVSGRFLRINRKLMGQPAARSVDVPKEAAPLSVPVPGTVSIPEGTLTASLGLIEGPIILHGGGVTLRIKAGTPLWLRTPGPGDRLRPVGRGGSRKLAALFQEARTPQWQRKHWPVVIDDQGPVWVPGIAVDERAVAGGSLNLVLIWEWNGTVETPQPPIVEPRR